MSEASSGACNADGSPYTPASSLVLTDEERSAIDKVIQDIPSMMRRKAIIFGQPQFMEREPDALGRLDELIVEILRKLKSRVPQDVAEKLYDRITTTSLVDQYEDEQGSISILCYRFMDTMQCMVSIKEKYRGRKCTSRHDKKYATEQLQARGVLRR